MCLLAKEVGNLGRVEAAVTTRVEWKFVGNRLSEQQNSEGKTEMPHATPNYRHLQAGSPDCSIRWNICQRKF